MCELLALFCALLARLAALWQGAAPPPLDARLAVLGGFAAELRALGPANFLYADADALFALGHRRKRPGRARAAPPGLWWLTQACDAVPTNEHDMAGVSVGQAAQSVMLLASVPLSDAAWRPLAEGELLVVRAGRLEASVLP